MLESKGATKVGEFYQKRYVYDFNPIVNGKWIRLRTNGKTSTLTIKEVLNINEIGGTNEIEIEVSDFEKTNIILNELGYKTRNYQENKRIRYILDNVEIEGKSEEDVKCMIDKLNIDKNKVTTLDVTSIYNEIYNIDVLKIDKLVF